MKVIPWWRSMFEDPVKELPVYRDNSFYVVRNLLYYSPSVGTHSTLCVIFSSLNHIHMYILTEYANEVNLWGSSLSTKCSPDDCCKIIKQRIYIQHFPIVTYFRINIAQVVQGPINWKQEVQGPWRSAWHLQLVWQMTIFCRLILKAPEI